MARSRDPDFDPCPEGEEGVIDLGHGVRMKFFTASDVDGHAGLIESHPTPEGGRCSGAISFDVPGVEREAVRWTVESWEPLTLSPSLLCRGCGHHGHIRNGRWEPA